MKAAVLREFGAPLEPAEIEEPSPGPGEVLVRVRAVGLCGSDLKLIGGVQPGTELPLVPGHEIAGELVAGGDPRKHGSLVACYHYESCGRCRWCRAGMDQLCPTAARVGRSRDGGLAELLVLREENALPFEGLSCADAAVAMDAVATPWRALRGRAKLAAGEVVAIAGAGGLGTNAIQIARDAGATVAVLDPDSAARSRALDLGATVAVAPGEADAVAALGDGGVDVGLEASGTDGGLQALASCVRPGGRIVCCGYTRGGAYELDSPLLVLSELTLLGSRASSRADAIDALAAVEQRRVAPVIAREFPLEQVNEAVDLLRRGGTAGRIVVEVQ